MATDRTQKRQQLKQQLLALIEANGEGGRLPPERELSERFEVARETLRRSLRELENDGLLERKQGAGTFVSGQPVLKQPQLLSFSEEMQERGLTPSSELLSTRRIAAGAKLAQRLKIVPGSPVLELRRLRMANGEPMALETVYLSQALLPGLEPQDLARGSLYEVLERQFGIQIRSASQQIQATVLSEEEADVLDVPPFSPSLLIERLSMSSGGEIVEYAKSLYRADRYRFEIQVLRAKPQPAPSTDAAA
ncbi:MAG TPA: GntR family transcriptional regulator [Roseateles sp.]|nr:GntR family transcriptional regulator [Roseateles sp.]